MSECIKYIKSDLYRYTGNKSLISFIKTYWLTGSFRYLVWVRINSILVNKKVYKYSFFPFSWIIWRRYSYKYGISIPYKTKIGFGIKINHFGGIIINSKCTIGNNVTICHGVTIGSNEVGNNINCPIIQDGVYISPGAKIIGNVNIGNNVIIGANSVVVKDVISNKIVGGIPAREIKDNNCYTIKNRYSELSE